MWRITLYHHIAEIDPQKWNSVGTDPLSTYAVLSALEEAGMPGVDMYYVVMENTLGHSVACAPYARIEIDAGQLTHGLFRRLISTIRGVKPDFMNTSLFICGTPLSVGNPPVRIANGTDPALVLKEAAGLLTELADEHNVPWRAFKEFPGVQLAAVDTLVHEGWLLAPSEPNFVLPLPWTSYRDYAGSLRSHYRYKLRKSERKFRCSGIQVEISPLADRYTPLLHSLYEDVLSRASVQLERLTPAFFLALGRNCGDRVQFIRFSRNGNVVGWVALLVDGNRVYDLFHGIDYEANDSSDLYFNQLSHTVRFAIESGARYLSFGQSTGTAKTRFGGQPMPLWIALRHRWAIVNAVLRTGSSFLFPEDPVPQRHVFTER